MYKKTIDIRTVGGSLPGTISFLENPCDIPFPIRRVYYICDVPRGTRRGMHAHRRLKQLLVCPHGAIEVLLDDGVESSRILLDSPSRGLFVDDMVWHEMVWEEDGSILLVLASMPYDEEDYIRDYDDFIKCLDR